MLAPLASTLRRSSQLYSRSSSIARPVSRSANIKKNFKGCFAAMVLAGLFYLSHEVEEPVPDLNRLESEVFSESPEDIRKAVSLAKIDDVGIYGLVINKDSSWLKQAVPSQDCDKIKLKDIVSSEKVVNTESLSSRMCHLGSMIWKLNIEVQQKPAFVVASIHPDFAGTWLESQLFKHSITLISKRTGLLALVNISEDTEFTDPASNLQKLTVTTYFHSAWEGQSWKRIPMGWESPKCPGSWHKATRSPTPRTHPTLNLHMRTTMASADATSYIVRLISIYPWMNIKDVELTLEYMANRGLWLDEFNQDNNALVLDFLDEHSEVSTHRV